MSYLAMSAAPFDSDNNNNIQNSMDTPINKKRQINSSHTKTQKMRQVSNDFNPDKVNSVLQSIHNNTSDDDELGNYNARVSAKHSDDFKPLNPYEFPDKPESVGSERKKMQEGLTNIDSSLVPQPTLNEDLKLQELQSNFMNDTQVKAYYKNLVPKNNNNNTNNLQYYQSQSDMLSQQVTNDSNLVLLEKLNYMINLLEEQQDQKTGNVTEEVVLYCFLGVFIIFVIDSFARVGKYVR
uniref:Uncharacterized protein n=1 Tax=viral metagenome TaxID=1070528 RepID=A0A6C0KPY2_9ZZZZ